MTETLKDLERRHNPGPSPDDISVHAFRSETECRYNVMPLWWWHPAAQQAMYEKWLARKLADAKAGGAAA